MKRWYLFIFFYLILILSLSAEEQKALNGIFLVPESAGDELTQGEPRCFHEGFMNVHFLNNQKNQVRIVYQDARDSFSCLFGVPEEKILKIGKYEDARDYLSYAGQPLLKLTLLGRINRSSIGEFEILELRYDNNGDILSFAADFKIRNDYRGRHHLYGTIRFNSSVPVREYFIQITNSNINFESPQLIYATKTDQDRQYKEKIIVKDKNIIDAKIYYYENGEVNLEISDSHACLSKNKIQLHLCSLVEFAKSNYINLERINTFNEYSDHYDSFGSSESFEDKNSLSIKWRNEEVVARKGNIIVSELLFDVRNHRILSLALDFTVEDDEHNLYEGTVRYNSTIPVFFK